MKKADGSRYTIKDFLEGKIFIDAPKGKHRDELFKVLDELGVKWRSGDCLLAGADYGLWGLSRPQTVLAVNYEGFVSSFRKYSITHASCEFRKRKNPTVPIVHAKDIDMEKQIIVRFDGPMTVATAFVGGMVIGVAEARCHPDDEYSEHIGARVVIGRLFGVEPEQPKKDEPVVLLNRQHRKELGVLYGMFGWKWLTKNQFGVLQVHEEKPRKEGAVWFSVMSSFIGSKEKAIEELVSWDDKEPLDIAKAIAAYDKRVKG